MDTVITRVSREHRDIVRSFVTKHWGAFFVIKHGKRFDLGALPGLIALRDGTITGLLLWEDRGAEVELITLDAVPSRQGIGGSLVDTFMCEALSPDCRRVSGTVTNDQLIALRLLQKRGFRITMVRPGAVDAAREIKPQIPVAGVDGIPLHDELDLVLVRSTRG
ncbi:GNAT family N-acetyltransferase [Amycolatopsis pithecellobii]|uniref:GNAT family N-acetyltransferase n=1 Tax=Amycolatopsis pithecellobii TaxID=664692 RepID=A0A6N7YW66_9PSEU|nr:GNAT family N-acetyltransferase [Amycolatopsis pithecellobii]MTD52579.1 GNAT family N-acetyltransferase [Amycolatopsis pithecellobii]